MAVIAVIEKEPSEILSWNQQSLRKMMRVFKYHLLIVWIEDNDLIETQSFLPHLVEHLTAAHKEYFAIVIHSFEAIPSEDFFGISYVVGEHNVPFAVGGSVHEQLGDAVQWFLGHPSVEVALVRVRHIDQKSSLSRLGNPCPVVELLNCAPIVFVVFFVFKVLHISFDLLECFEFFTVIALLTRENKFGSWTVLPGVLVAYRFCLRRK
jgi:hypothetical protein